MCLMDLPVRFSVCSRAPPPLPKRRSRAHEPCCCLSPGAGGSRRGGDEIRLIMAALFFGWMRRSRVPVDQETPGQTETHKGSGEGSARPFLCSLPTYTTFCSSPELLPPQPFTRIKAVSQPVGTLTFAFCLIQSIFLENTTSFFFFFLSRSHIHHRKQHGALSFEGHSI